jgi:hypothetical protein
VVIKEREMSVDRVIELSCSIRHRTVKLAEIDKDALRLRIARIRRVLAEMSWARHRWPVGRYDRLRQRLVAEEKNCREALMIARNAHGVLQDLVFGTNQISEDPEFVARFLAEPTEDE